MKLAMQVDPILSSMRKHKAAVVLLVLEIALTMAVLGNLLFIVHGSFQRSRTPTGAMENDIGFIQSIGTVGMSNPGTAAGNLAVLRGVPGVIDAAYGGPPLWYVERDPVFLDPSRPAALTHAYEFQGSQGLSQTLGVHVVQGKNLEDGDLPLANEITSDTQFPVLVTRSLARRLFPDGEVLGRLLYDGGSTLRVVGVMDHLRGEITGRPEDDYSILAEYRVGAQNLGGGFMVRSRPGELKRTLRAAAAALEKANPGHVQQKVFTLSDLRGNYFQADVSVGRMLIAIMLVLLVVTMLGVAGLTSFWVQQRRRQIGVRRALGATRYDILYYFLVENFLIVSAGIILGALFAFVLNHFLMDRFEVRRLPYAYLPLGAVVLWLVGQAAVFGPVRRAMSMPPVAVLR